MDIEPVSEEQVHTLPKKVRRRKKQLYHSILEQMEFYFSDSNLGKDRFLSQLIKTDPYIDITQFLQFNKIRKLTTSVEDVAKAISKSELIELSEDKTKVRRKMPIKEKENVEECTIYVERLKSDATHEWLTSIFSEFGKVVYVSIPKYKHNGMIRGFAFVEFDDEKGAAAALQYFESINCKIPSFMEPQKLYSIATYESSKQAHEDASGNMKQDDIIGRSENVQERTVKKQKHSDNTKEDEGENKKRKIEHEETKEAEEKEKQKLQLEVDKESKKKAKRKNETDVQNTKNAKKRKLDVETDNEVQQQLAVDEEVKEKKIKIDHPAETDNTVQQEAVFEDESEDKKKKKQKKLHRKRVNLKEIGLQILSKKEWKKMRNRYLDMQKKTMKELKMHLNRQRFVNRYDNRKKHHFEKQQQNEMAMTHESVNKKIEKPMLTFIPGTIVKISLETPCEDNKALKNEIKASCPAVKYVDIPLPAGSEEVFVRLSSAENAKSFCSSDYKAKMCILDGDDEQKYWERIEATMAKKNQRVKQRGRDKLLKKAEKQVAKHVRFDGSDGE